METCFCLTADVPFHVQRFPWFNSWPLTDFFQQELSWAAWELGLGLLCPPLSSLLFLEMGCPQEALIQWQTLSLWQQWGWGGEDLPGAALPVTGG